MVDVKAIQSELRASKIDGWLFYDHHRRDPIANIILKLGSNGLASRRWFYFIPSKGEPRKLVHRIEAGMLNSLDGRKYVYSGWEELHKTLPKLLSGSKTIAMQYSPENNIPYIGLVDAGTVELIRKLKKKVVSSANLVQKFEATWSNAQLESHLDAGKIIDRVRQDAFLRAAEFVRDGKPLTEYDLQQWIADQFRAKGLFPEATIVAVQPNNGNPHYEPKSEGSRPIRAGDLLLLDMWSKFERPGSVFYDITWMGYLGNRVPDTYAKIFRIVRQARDNAVELVKEAVAKAAQSTDGKLTAPRARRFAKPATRNISSIAPDTASAKIFTATAQTWTASRLATTAKSFPIPVFRSSLEFISPISASAAK